MKKIWEIAKILIGVTMRIFTGCVVITVVLGCLGIGYTDIDNGPEETATPGAFSSTLESNTYHLSICGQAEHQRGMKIYYDSQADAERAGKWICGLCRNRLEAYGAEGMPDDSQQAYYKGYVTGYLEGFELPGAAKESCSLLDATVLALCGILFGGVSVLVLTRKRFTQLQQEHGEQIRKVKEHIYYILALVPEEK